jgi:hypothetical protein
MASSPSPYKDNLSSLESEIQSVQFSKQVDRALQDLLPSQDIFDSPFFDSVDYINQLFPNEQSLNENLDSFILKVKKRIYRVDNEILETVRKQSSSGVQAQKDFEDTKTTIKVCMNQDIFSVLYLQWWTHL